VINDKETGVLYVIQLFARVIQKIITIITGIYQFHKVLSSFYRICIICFIYRVSVFIYDTKIKRKNLKYLKYLKLFKILKN